MRTTVLVGLAVVLLALPAAAKEPPTRHVIEGVEPMEGPDPLVKSLGRAIRTAVDPTISDDYLAGISGSAFLATVWFSVSGSDESQPQSEGPPQPHPEPPDGETWTPWHEQQGASS